MTETEKKYEEQISKIRLELAEALDSRDAWVNKHKETMKAWAKTISELEDVKQMLVDSQKEIKDDADEIYENNHDLKAQDYLDDYFIKVYRFPFSSVDSINKSVVSLVMQSYAEHYHEIKSKEDKESFKVAYTENEELLRDRRKLKRDLKKAQARINELEEKLERAEYLNKINSKINPKTK